MGGRLDSDFLSLKTIDFSIDKKHYELRSAVSFINFDKRKLNGVKMAGLDILLSGAIYTRNEFTVS